MARCTFMVRATLLIDGKHVRWAGDVGGLPCTGDEPTALLAARLTAALFLAEPGIEDFVEFTYTRIA